MRLAAQFGWLESLSDGGLRPIPLDRIASVLGAPDCLIDSWDEAVLVHQMCRDFYDGFNNGKEPLSIPPWER